MAHYKDTDLFRVLKEMEVVPVEGLDSALEESRKTEKSFDDVLVERNLLSENNLGKIIADLLSVRFIDLSSVSVTQKMLNIIPEVVAKKHQIIAFNMDQEGLHLAMRDPANNEIAKFIEKKVGADVIRYYTTERSINDALNLYSKDVETAFDEIIKESVKDVRNTKKSEPSIIKIVDTTIKYAHQNKSSDIHVEPMDEDSLVRFRIDGILHDIVHLPKELHEQIVTRIKVMASLRTDEHLSAQDGKLSFKLKKEKLDIRVSIVPITNGEKVVMRLLSERSRQFSLSDLGLADKDLKRVEEAYKRPHGMILVTGPTGSGKTTTLYAILKILNKRDVNIMTIEDPVEYDIEGINQIQVNEQTELTFAKGLRSIVRQDPDIILVGEIRDNETADISINAAMTGHLVLSTLHTNDAATAIPRLIDLGIEPYLIASTVNVVVAQRLVRKICESCRISKELSVNNDNDKPNSGNLSYSGLVNKYLGVNSARIYEGKGCPVCHKTGYLGRIGIFETMVINDQIRDSIVKKNNSQIIKKLALESGMTGLIEDGFGKVKNGITTIDEVLRVSKD